jgi:hypothetical protein
MVRRSFIKTFIAHVGECEVPRQFFEWSAISLLAAALGDRTWYEKFASARLVPNLYVFLIGPSGLGKGVAIDAVQHLVNDVPAIGYYRGQVTGPYLVDYLSDRAGKRKAGTPSRLYLITPELSLSVGMGDQADRLIKLMTELYTGGDYEFREGTRTNKSHVFRVPYPNWLAGSIEEWVVSSLSREALAGGFFARAVGIEAAYDFTRRCHEPTAHPRYAQLCRWLQRRIHTYATKVEGRMLMTRQAWSLDKLWYETRDVPQDEALLPAWKRAHDLSIKLAMLFAKDTDPRAQFIRRAHLAKGQQYAESTLSIVPRLITLASMTPESDALRFVTRVIEQSGEEGITAHDLIGRAADRGLPKERTEVCAGTLVAARKVLEKQGKNATIYVWKSRKISYGKRK